MIRFTVFTLPALLIFSACTFTPKKIAREEGPATAPVAVSAPAPDRKAVTETVTSRPKAQKPFKTLVLDHKFFKIYYDPDLKLPRYVVYTLTAEHMRNAYTKRKDRFRADPLLVERGLPYVDKKEYLGSGYDRGHLAPFKDFAWDEEAGMATFVMSNMVPQSKKLNQQAWEDLEDQVRKWACGEERVFVITGPIMDDRMPKLSSGLPVPNRFFKIIIDETPPRKATAFIYYQSDSRKGLIEERQVTPQQVVQESQIDLDPLVKAQDRALLKQRSPLQSWKSNNCVGIAARAQKKSERTARERDAE